MAMYVPLFASVSAQYQKGGAFSPQILALDEAFAGGDHSAGRRNPGGVRCRPERLWPSLFPFSTMIARILEQTDNGTCIRGLQGLGELQSGETVCTMKTGSCATASPAW